MTDQNLSHEEKQLLKKIEAGEFESHLTEKRANELKDAAHLTFKKDERINIRISSRDLLAIQSRASREGIPYQTLVSSILHKYVSGSLQEVQVTKKQAQ